MKPDVIIEQLHMRVSPADRSYMPQQIIISAGCDVSDLHEIKDVRIPRYVSPNRFCLFLHKEALSVTVDYQLWLKSYS